MSITSQSPELMTSCALILRGAPARHSMRGIMTLAVGEWGRLHFNYRTPAYEDTWRYDHWVLNIGLFTMLEANVFEATHPLKTYSNMADLW